MTARGSRHNRTGDEAVTTDDLPERIFVSASYRDTAAVKKLRRSLPAVEVISFPRAEPDPGRAVSDEIIPAILGCSGLIYLKGGASADSFWVGFERDYALRAGRQVFSYSPGTGTFRRDRSEPLPLSLTVIFHTSDEHRVRRLVRWMATERHFEIDDSCMRSTLGGFTGKIVVQMEELLFKGGNVLWLMGAGNARIAQTFYSEEFVDYLVDDPDNDWLEDEWREFLEKVHAGDEEWSYDGEDEYCDESGAYYSKRDFVRDCYDNICAVFARMDPELRSDWMLLPWAAPEIAAEGGRGRVNRVIDLYDGTDGTDLNWNRVDDLIIALYQVLSTGSGPQVEFRG
jgi:hypothetical protein